MAPNSLLLARAPTSARSRCDSMTALRRACSGWAVTNPTCRERRHRRWQTGRRKRAAPACGSIIPDTANRAALSTTARSTACARGPQIVIGTSMGGWLALLLARALRARKEPTAATIAGLVLVAPAVDFTEELMGKRFTPEIRRERAEQGVWARPSQYSPEPYLVTRQLIAEGRNHLLLGGMIETGCPVRILQGVQDPDVPWQHAKALVARFACDDVVLTLIKDGDHRLSRPEDIERLIRAVEEF